MKVFVTGANGLVGQTLIRLLIEEGKFDVHASGKGPSRIAYKKKYACTYHNLDLANHKKTQQLIEHLAPSVIIHLACISQPNDCELDKTNCWKINVGGTRALVRAAQKVHAYFIYISTDFVFDGEEGPYDETATPAPVNTYGESKLLAEQIVEMSGLPWAIVRTVLVFGQITPGGRSNFVLWVKNQLEKGLPMKIVDDQIRTPTYVEDFAKGILLVLLKHATGIYHIAGRDTCTPYELALKIAGLMGKDPKGITRVTADTFEEPARRPLKTGFVIHKAIRELGYSPLSINEALSLTLDIY